MTRVLIVAPSFTPGNQAYSFRARKLRDQLSRIGFEVATDAPLEEFLSAERARRERDGRRSPLNLRKMASLCWRAVLGVLSPPDRTVWAVLRLRRAIRSKRRVTPKSDVILVTAPPYLLLCLGLAMKEVSGGVLVVDFRDDWITNGRMRWWTPVHRAVASRIERRIVRSANGVVLNTKVVAARFAERYPEEISKLCVVTNGFDARSVASAGEARSESEGPLRVGYFGSDYEGFSVETIDRLCRVAKEKNLLGHLVFETAGMGAWRGAGREGLWIHHGVFSEAESAEAMAACHCLLLLMPKGESEPSGTIPLKAFSYLGSGRFVLYVGERGATTELLGEFPGTKCVGRSELETLPRWCRDNEEALRRRYERPEIEKYSDEAVARRMAYALSRALRDQGEDQGYGASESSGERSKDGSRRDKDVC